MRNNWEKEYSTEPLEQFQQVAPDLYRQRKNGYRIPPKSDEEIGETWVYDSRTISKQQYEEYMNALNSPVNEQIRSDFQSVTINQDQLNDNSLVTMSALADMYELLTNALLQLQGGSDGSPIRDTGDQQSEDV